MSGDPARLRNQALYSFINPPLSFFSLSPKVNPVSVMFLMVTVCVRNLREVPVFRTVVTLHLWVTLTSGHPLPQLLTRTATVARPMLPLGSHHLQRYEIWTAEHIKDFQMTIKSTCKPLWKCSPLLDVFLDKAVFQCKFSQIHHQRQNPGPESL